MSDEKNLVEWGGWVQGGRISAATPKISAATPISSATPIISAATPIISSATPKIGAATPGNWRGDPQDLARRPPKSSNFWHGFPPTPTHEEKKNENEKKRNTYLEVPLRMKIFRIHEFLGQKIRLNFVSARDSSPDCVAIVAFFRRIFLLDPFGGHLVVILSFPEGKMGDFSKTLNED